MAGITVHTSSPINPHTPTRSREATEEPPSAQDLPAWVAASNTAFAMNFAQTAQPAAAPVPAPSAAANAYTPTSPTQTTALPAVTTPSAPQPGQAPEPFFVERGRTMPPPPQPGPVPQPQQSASPTSTQPSPRRFPVSSAPMWNPKFAYGQSSGGLSAIPRDLSHPPGYEQHRGSFDDRYFPPAEENRTHTPSPSRGRGILDGGSFMAEESSPIWNRAMSFAKEAGRKLSVVEDEVWKKINGDR